MSTKPMPVRRAREFLSAPVRTAVLLLFGAGLVAAMDPAHNHVPLCPFHSLTGLDCPFCGGLRCVDALVHGQFATALRSNVLVVLAIPVTGVLLVRWYLAERAGRRLPEWPRALKIAFVVLWLAFAVVRNLPGMQFLRPVA